MYQRLYSDHTSYPPCGLQINKFADTTVVTKTFRKPKNKITVNLGRVRLLRRLVAEFSLQGQGFNSRQFHVVDNVTLEQDFLEVFLFLLSLSSY